MFGKSGFIYVIILIGLSLKIFPQFSAGNLVVLQIGNGLTPLINTGNPIMLKEFSQLGGLTYSVAIPVLVNPIVIGGTAISEGGLSLSPNGKFLVFAGYATALGFSTSLSSSPASSVNRAIGIVSANGSYSRIATSTNYYSGNGIRSAASEGNDNYWAAGANAGANYFGNNSTPVTLQSSVTNARNVIAMNGNIFLSTGSGTAGIYKVGSGFPINSGQTCTLFLNTSGSGQGTASPFAFYFNSNNSICYVADDRNSANGGGIQKWIYSANIWTLAYILPTGSTFGARGIVVDFNTASPRVYATTSESSLNRLIVINDLGVGSTATTIATAGFSTIFRGLAFSPFCTAPTISSIVSSPTVCANQVFTLTGNYSGTAPLSYAWSGPGNFTASVANPSPIATNSGIFSMTVANGCGSAALSNSVVVNPLPVISTGSYMICSGGTATINVNGAAYYSWSNQAIDSTIYVSPTVSSIYSVSGTNMAGCTSSTVALVNVLSALTISVSSVEICVGATATLEASGASNYSWNNGAMFSTISVSPAITTTYVVTGTAPGCSPNTAVANVTVNQAPWLSIEPKNAMYCATDSIILLKGSPPGGMFSGDSVLGNTFDPSRALAGNFKVSYHYTDDKGCSATDSTTILVDLCTSIEKERNNLSVKLYPNPVKDVLYIKLSGFSEVVTVRILNMYAETVLDGIYGRGQFTADATLLLPGVYLARICSQSKCFLIRFIKQ